MARWKIWAVLAGLLALALAAAGMGFRAWLEGHDARLTLQATLRDTERERDQAAAALAVQLAAIAQEKQAVRTPAQAVQVINRYVPLPVPLRAEPEALPVAVVGGLELPLPDKPMAQPLVIPAQDLKPLADFVEDCRSCQAKLQTAEQDNQQLLKERDAAVQTVKGGSWMHRLVRNAKWLVIGAVAGAVAAKAVSR